MADRTSAEVFSDNQLDEGVYGMLVDNAIIEDEREDDSGD